MGRWERRRGLRESEGGVGEHGTGLIGEGSLRKLGEKGREKGVCFQRKEGQWRASKFWFSLEKWELKRARRWAAGREIVHESPNSPQLNQKNTSSILKECSRVSTLTCA